MGEPTMEEYITKTQEDYGSRIEVILFYKGLDVPTRQILDSKSAIPSMNAADAKKAIQEMANHSQKWHNGTSTMTRGTNTSDGLAALQAQLNNLGRNIKKVNEKVYAAQVESAMGFYQRDNENPTYQEQRKTMEGSMNKFMAESAKRHDEISILIKEIRSSTDATIRNQRAPIKALEIQIGDHVKSILTTIKTDTTSIRRIGGARYAVLDNQNRIQTFKTNQSTIPFPTRLADDCYKEINVLDSATYGLFKEGRRMEDQVSKNEDPMPQKERDLRSLGDLAPINLTIVLADKKIKYPKGVAEKVLVGIGKFVFPIDFVVLDIPEDVKVPLIIRRPFLSTTHAKIDVIESEITLRVGNENVTFKIVENMDGYRDQDMGNVSLESHFASFMCRSKKV
nr:hypothetical protein [Tanacetum cinerariifolium]